MISLNVQKYKYIVNIDVPVTAHLVDNTNAWVTIKIFHQRQSKNPLLKAKVEIPIDEYAQKEEDIKKFYTHNSVMNVNHNHLARRALPYKTYRFSNYHPSGKTQYTVSIKDTFLHSIDDRPSFIEYDGKGKPMKIQYHNHGQIQRPLANGAAHTSNVYDLQGSKIGMNEQFIDGDYQISKHYRVDAHTPDLPKLMVENHTKKGKNHRTNGPAAITFDGKKYVHKFFVEGIFLGTDLNLSTEEEILMYYQNHQLMD